MKTERQLRQNLREAMGEATVIIVAQRLSTIMDADRILVIDDGRIVGQGTHKELLQNLYVVSGNREYTIGRGEREG